MKLFGLELERDYFKKKLVVIYGTLFGLNACSFLS